MTVACVVTLVASVILTNVGAQAPAASTLEPVGVLGGVMLFAVGAVLMVAQAAGKDPVLPNAGPWSGDDE